MKLKLTILLLISFLASGCTSLEQLQRLNLPSVEVDFSTALAREYRDFSQSEENQYDWYDSGYFARKGLRAARGIATPPEALERWDLPKEEVSTLRWARNRLVSILTDGVKSKYPRKAAKAQFLFDCWVEQQEENWQKEDINNCRMDFLMEMAELEHHLFPKPKITKKNLILPDPSRYKKTMSKKPVVAKPKAVSFKENYLVYFDFGKYDINKEAEIIIKKAVGRTKSMNTYLIKVDGHADRAGAGAYNKKLSQRRASAVSARFEKGGISKNSMKINAYGEGRPAKNTKDGVGEKLNRRVEIIIEGSNYSRSE